MYSSLNTCLIAVIHVIMYIKILKTLKFFKCSCFFDFNVNVAMNETYIAVRLSLGQ